MIWERRGSNLYASRGDDNYMIYRNQHTNAFDLRHRRGDDYGWDLVGEYYYLTDAKQAAGE